MDNSTTPEIMSVAAVIPCYQEKEHILEVIAQIGPEVDRIIVVVDACPDGTGRHVEIECRDPRLVVLFHVSNQGVGGATLSGYRKAIEMDAQVIVKIDGDGQMDPGMIEKIVRPIVSGRADYAKGNRFYNVEGVSEMPRMRLLGNLFLSFASKLSSGYWHIFDATNGFTAIHANVAAHLPLEKIDRGYFIESDLLFRLNISRAMVADVPMQSHYGNETSSLRISRILFPFIWKHSSNLFRRIIYSYFIRDFTIASIELVLGLALIGFGTIFGAVEWYQSYSTGIPATAGTVIIAALPFLVGSQLFISFLNFDVNNQPDTPLHNVL